MAVCPDRYGGNVAASLMSPIVSAFAVTPSDSAMLQERPRGLTVTVDGLVNMEFPGGATVAIHLVKGVIFWARPIRILSTTTAATGIIALV